MEETPDIIIFLGRFHPLVVHLPIGFLILAIVFEWLSLADKTVRLTWLLGATSATVAATLGYLLSFGGDYNEDTLAWHMWSGITLAFISFACYFLKGIPRARTIYRALSVATALLLAITGHYGGSLTHGSQYLLEYAPAPIRTLAGRTSEGYEDRPPVASLDSADIFLDAIMPIMRQKCINCHNADKRKGKLLLTSYEAMLKGGEDGPGIVPGSLDSSEVFRRITLPSDHKDFMPAEGKRPLTDDQVAVIEWWIVNHAPQLATVASLSPDKGSTELLVRYFGLGTTSLDELIAPPADTTVVNRLTRQGFLVNRLSAKSNFLEVVLPEGTTKKIDITLLAALKDQLVWLKLPNGSISDSDLEVLGGLVNLRKLNLSRNPVSDAGVLHLSALNNLEYLNLYATQVSDNGVNELVKLPALSSLFVWQTKVTGPGMDSVIARNPKVRITYHDPVE